MSTVYLNNDPVSENGFVSPFVVSFEDHFKALSLPAIDFECQGETLTFIIDSGRDACHISRTVAQRLGLETRCEEVKERKEKVLGTGNGIAKSTGEFCQTGLSIGDFKFNVHFYVEDFDTLTAFLKNSSGVTVHGVLGTDFLVNNNWQIDFMNKVAYPVFKLRR